MTESGQLERCTVYEDSSFQGLANGSVKAHGFYYLTKEPARSSLSRSSDAEPNDVESLRLGTAAVLTFRKKGVGDTACAADSGKSSDSPSPPAEASTDDLPVWTPNEKLAEELGAYQDVDDFEIRLPKGYEGGETPGTLPGTSVKLFGFSAKEPAQGVKPMLSFIIQKTPPGQKPETLDHTFEFLFSKLQGYGANWQHATIERGKIGELICLRSRCECPSAAATKMLGFVYLCQVDANTLVMMLAADGESQNVRALKIANTAVLTIRKK